MRIKVLASSLLTLVATALASQAQTNQSATAAPAPQPSPFEQSLLKIKQPVSWFTWGGDLRFRNEYFNNLITLNKSDAGNLNEQDYFRYRGRVWASIRPINDLSLNARLATEPRTWMRPAGYSVFRPHVGTDWTEGIIDNLNVQWKNIAGSPVSAIVGRQDIFLGDGWLVGDGTPFDGSWTYFLDAARVTYEMKDQHTTFEAIGIIQDGHDDGWMPVIGRNNGPAPTAPAVGRIFTEQNEKGAIFQVANTSLKAANLTGYFIYKHDNALNGISPGNRPDNADIYTLGGRINGLVGDNWKYWVEGAYQFGQKEYPITGFATPGFPINLPAGTSRDISAFGINSKATYMFKDKLNNQLTASFEFLSGDDPNSGKDEAFDVLWGRWPHWSETGLYMYPAETRIGSEANLIRFGPTWSIDPLKSLNFTASYFALFAQQDTATLGSTTLFTDNGNFRGHFVTGVLKYKFGPHVSGHLWSEFMFPGDYYVHKDMMTFLRAEVMFTF